MARFARPYCATEPVRTVPFFNLYDDIQITGVGRISYALEQSRGCFVYAYSGCQARRPIVPSNPSSQTWHTVRMVFEHRGEYGVPDGVLQ